MTLADGKVLEADHVILTAPPSTGIASPSIRCSRRRWRRRWATNVKCLIALKSRFWRRAELGPEMLSDGPFD